MEIRIEDYKVGEDTLNFTIQEKEINGITGPDKELLMNILYLKNEYKGKVYINGTEIDKKEVSSYKRKISIVKKEMDWPYFSQKVYECMYLEIQRKRLSLKNPKKKILDSLKIVGLDVSYLNRDIKDLSSSEKKLLQLGLSLMSNPEVIVLEDPFKNFDRKIEKKTLMLLQKIKDQYDKTIVFVSDDSNELYQYTTHLIIGKNHKIIEEGETKEIYKRVDFLKRQGISIPKIVEFTYLAKKKNVKIDYHRDIRDIIKDIYKHV